jgi:hypothetical protein
VADIKADVRVLRDRVDLGNAKSLERTDSTANRLDHKFDKVASDMDAKFHRLDNRIEKFGSEIDVQFHRVDDKMDRLAQSLAKTQVWAVLLYVAMAGGMLGTMARGFGWM